jgi:hypothetical protein
LKPDKIVDKTRLFSTIITREMTEKDEDKKEVEDEKVNKRSNFEKEIHEIASSAIPVMKEAAAVVLTVLDSTIFIASELTFQTQYTVAIKAVTLFYSVSLTGIPNPASKPDIFDRRIRESSMLLKS